MMTRKVLNIRALLLALFISVSIGVFAQTSVRGVVLEPSGEPAIGATIMEKGTSVGTATDFDGNFSIKVASPNAVLVVSYVGMETQEVKLAGRTDVTITLKESGVALDEVVVVGYGTMKKSDLAGASVSMSEDDLKGSIITNLDQSLQGRATGVQAMSTSGAPGSSSSIRVRGQSTINANAEPLYVIDGVIVQGGVTQEPTSVSVTPSVTERCRPCRRFLPSTLPTSCRWRFLKTPLRQPSMVRRALTVLCSLPPSVVRRARLSSLTTV